MNRNEEPDETIRREMREEVGLDIVVIKPLLIARTPFLRAHLDIAYLCTLPEDGEIRLSSELLAYDWIDPMRLPPMGNFHTRVVKLAVTERTSVIGIGKA